MKTSRDEIKELCDLDAVETTFGQLLGWKTDDVLLRLAELIGYLRNESSSNDSTLRLMVLMIMREPKMPRFTPA